MNDDTFNIQTRKFLKKVGINAQREIEAAVRQAIEQGKIKGDETLNASVVLEVQSVGLNVKIEDDIALE